VHELYRSTVIVPKNPEIIPSLTFTLHFLEVDLPCKFKKPDLRELISANIDCF